MFTIIHKFLNEFDNADTVECQTVSKPNFLLNLRAHS